MLICCGNMSCYITLINNYVIKFEENFERIVIKILMHTNLFIDEG